MLQINLRETLGIDIADRLRSHFLSNMPTKSMNWFNSAGPNKNSTNTHQSALDMAQNNGMQNGKYCLTLILWQPKSFLFEYNLI